MWYLKRNSTIRNSSSTSFIRMVTLKVCHPQTEKPTTDPCTSKQLRQWWPSALSILVDFRILCTQAVSLKFKLVSEISLLSVNHTIIISWRHIKREQRTPSLCFFFSGLPRRSSQPLSRWQRRSQLQLDEVRSMCAAQKRTKHGGIPIPWLRVLQNHQRNSSWSGASCVVRYQILTIYGGTCGTERLRE